MTRHPDQAAASEPEAHGDAGRAETELTGRFTAAVAYALEAHAGQRRKGTAVPYAAHLLAVAALVLEDGGSETEAIAALLHDVVEDQGGHERLRDVHASFGQDVAAIVEACTDYDTVGERGRWAERKQAHLERIAALPPAALRVSLADKLHNARAILRDYDRVGEVLWSRFNAGREAQLWYLRGLADAFAGASTSPMADELETVVAELESRVAGRARSGAP